MVSRKGFVISLLLIFTGPALGDGNNGTQKFPDYFKFGAGNSAYQTEGAWNVSGKGVNIWDELTHHSSDAISDRSNGDVACDSYRLFKKDVEILRELGVDFYRFSLSWSRLLPDGHHHLVNEDGVRYYGELIDELIKYNITPLVTIYHWDLPLKIQHIGGWTNPLIVDYFVEFARIVFDKFGDRVKNWITINEPYIICQESYGRLKPRHAPALHCPGVCEYLCGHHVLLAHAGAWHMYNDNFRQKQKGRVGITLVSYWFQPESDSPIDKDISDRMHDFYLGWHAHPLFIGDYPQVMRETVDINSHKQGFTKSKLPVLTKEQVAHVKGSIDFLGLNYYTTMIANRTGGKPDNLTSKYADEGYKIYQLPNWPSTPMVWFKVYPPGIRRILNWIKEHYNNPTVIITENGLATVSGHNDVDRVSYMNKHLEQVRLAIEDGCNVTWYCHWSLLDNFEWIDGYDVRFGLYDTDFKHPNKTRTPKLSALVYKEIVRTRRVNEDYRPNVTMTKPVISSAPSSPTRVKSGANNNGHGLSLYLTCAVNVVVVLVLLINSFNIRIVCRS